MNTMLIHSDETIRISVVTDDQRVFLGTVKQDMRPGASTLFPYACYPVAGDATRTATLAEAEAAVRDSTLAGKRVESLSRALGVAFGLRS